MVLGGEFSGRAARRPVGQDRKSNRDSARVARQARPHLRHLIWGRSLWRTSARPGRSCKVENCAPPNCFEHVRPLPGVGDRPACRCRRDCPASRPRPRLLLLLGVQLDGGSFLSRRNLNGDRSASRSGLMRDLVGVSDLSGHLLGCRPAPTTIHAPVRRSLDQRLGLVGKKASPKPGFADRGRRKSCLNWFSGRCRGEELPSACFWSSPNRHRCGPRIDQIRPTSGFG